MCCTTCLRVCASLSFLVAWLYHRKHCVRGSRSIFTVICLGREDGEKGDVKIHPFIPFSPWFNFLLDKKHIQRPWSITSFQMSPLSALHPSWNATRSYPFFFFASSGVFLTSIYPFTPIADWNHSGLGVRILTMEIKGCSRNVRRLFVMWGLKMGEDQGHQEGWVKTWGDARQLKEALRWEVGRNEGTFCQVMLRTAGLL